MRLAVDFKCVTLVLFILIYQVNNILSQDRSIEVYKNEFKPRYSSNIKYRQLHIGYHHMLTTKWGFSSSIGVDITQLLYVDVNRKILSTPYKPYATSFDQRLRLGLGLERFYSINKENINIGVYSEFLAGRTSFEGTKILFQGENNTYPYPVIALYDPIWLISFTTGMGIYAKFSEKSTLFIRTGLMVNSRSANNSFSKNNFSQGITYGWRYAL